MDDEIIIPAEGRRIIAQPASADQGGELTRMLYGCRVTGEGLYDSGILVGSQEALPGEAREETCELLGHREGDGNASTAGAAGTEEHPGSQGPAKSLLQ